MRKMTAGQGATQAAWGGLGAAIRGSRLGRREQWPRHRKARLQQGGRVRAGADRFRGHERTGGEAGIKHQRVSGRALRHSGAHPRGGCARWRWGPLCPRARKPAAVPSRWLPTRPTRAIRPTGMAGSALPAESVVVCRWTVLQPGSPEGGHIHGHGVIASVCLRLPLPCRLHLRLPPRQQPTDRPLALPRAPPTPGAHAVYPERMNQAG